MMLSDGVREVLNKLQLALECHQSYRSPVKTSELLANLVTSFTRIEDLCQTLLPSAEDKTGSNVPTATASGNELTQTPQGHHFAASDKLEATQTESSCSSQPSPSFSLMGTLSFPRLPSSSQAIQSQTPFSSETFLEQDTLDMEKEIDMAKSEIESMLNSRFRTTSTQLESSSSTQLSQPSSLRAGRRPPLPPNDTHRGERRANLLPPSSSSTQCSPMPSPLLPPSPPAPLNLNLSQQSEIPTSSQTSSSSQSLEVVANYASESSRSIFLRCQELNWIRVSGRPLYWNSESKIMICDLADRGKRLVDRSLLYMKCLVLGFLIVDFEWLTDSLQSNRLLAPHEYEVLGCVGDTVPKAPLRSRCLQRNSEGHITLLRGCSFSVIDDREDEVVKREDVEWLVVHCGGLLVRHHTSSTTSNHQESTLHINLSLRLWRKTHTHGSHLNLGPSASRVGTLYSVNWLFDAICNLRLPPDGSIFTA
eukprot:scaffold1034_cov175-Ochromonas_danica.AAC.6